MAEQKINVGKFINNLDTEDLTSEKLQGVVNNVYAKAITQHKKADKQVEDNFKEKDKETTEFVKSNHDRLKANKDKVAKEINESFSIVNMNNGDQFGPFETLGIALNKAKQYGARDVVIIDKNTREWYRISGFGKAESMGKIPPFFDLGESKKSGKSKKLKEGLTPDEGAWITGTISKDGGEYEVQAKVFDEPSEFGIDHGRISKLWVKEKGWPVCISYDRGWDIYPQTNEDLLNFVMKEVEKVRDKHPLSESKKTRKGRKVNESVYKPKDGKLYLKHRRSGDIEELTDVLQVAYDTSPNINITFSVPSKHDFQTKFYYVVDKDGNRIDLETGKIIKESKQINETVGFDRFKENITPEIEKVFKRIKKILKDENSDTYINGFYFPKKAVNLL